MLDLTLDQKKCQHDDQESWCAACGKPVDGDYGCGTCGGGPACSAHCLDCGAVQYASPNGEWEL